MALGDATLSVLVDVDGVALHGGGETHLPATLHAMVWAGATPNPNPNPNPNPDSNPYPSLDPDPNPNPSLDPHHSPLTTQPSPSPSPLTIHPSPHQVHAALSTAHAPRLVQLVWLVPHAQHPALAEACDAEATRLEAAARRGAAVRYTGLEP